MKQERFYKVHVQLAEVPDAIDDYEYATGNVDEPEGWREFAIQHPRIDDDAEFFLPRMDKIFRSRSAAKEHLSLFTRWGIDAHLVECTPAWESIPDANARRARERTVA